jgi:DNA-binding transcriptional LysR family regulator
MTLRQLTIFQAVASYRSITKAASHLGISQPSVSKQVTLLEREFGVKFHLRVGQGIKLTQEGNAFRLTFGSILPQVEAAERTFRNKISRETSGCLTVGGSRSPSAHLLPRVLQAFRQSHPDVRTVLRTADNAAIERMILNSEVEIAVITNPSSDPQIAVELLGRRNVIAAVSVRHPLARLRKLSEHEFAKAPLITIVGSRIATTLEQMGLKLNIIMECESPEIVKAAVESGSGIGLLYHDFVERDLANGYLRAIEIPRLKELEFKTVIIYHRRASLSPYAQDALSLLRRWRWSSPNFPEKA